MSLKHGVGKRTAVFFAFVARCYFENFKIPGMAELQTINDIVKRANEYCSTETRIISYLNLIQSGHGHVMKEPREKETLLRQVINMAKELESPMHIIYGAVKLLDLQLNYGQPLDLLKETCKLFPPDLTTVLSIMEDAIPLSLSNLKYLETGVESPFDTTNITPKYLHTIEMQRYIAIVIYEHQDVDIWRKSMARYVVSGGSNPSHLTTSMLNVRVLAMQYTNLVMNGSEKEALDEIMELVDENIMWMRHFASQETNEDHCKYLIALAERDRISSANIWDSIQMYENAILFAQNAGFTLWEAYATELMAKLFVSQKNDRFSQNCLLSAHTLWRQWGSEGKAEQLVQMYPEYFPLVIPKKVANSSLTGPTDLTTSTLDVVTMLKVAQSIANESNLEELMGKVIRNVMINTCAKKGVLLLNDNGKLSLIAHGESIEGLDMIKVLDRQMPLEKIGLTGEGAVPLSIVLYVFRSRDFVVLQDASTDQVYSNDAYIRFCSPSSILCIPIIHQNTISGVLYLENASQVGVFNTNRVEFIKSLMASTSIAIENAKLMRKNTELAIALKETQVGHDDVLGVGPRYNIDAPIKKTIDVLSSMKTNLSPGDPTIKQIDFVMRMLTSSDLFASSIDDINDEQGRGIDQDTKTWIETSLLQKHTRTIGLASQDEAADDMSLYEDGRNSSSKMAAFRGGDIVSLESSAEILGMLEKSNCPGFDVLKFATVTSGRPLYYLGCHFLERYGLIKHFSMPENQMRTFFETIEASYHNHLPYHNSSHAADVLQTVSLLLLGETKMATHFTKLEILAACIASAVHDVEHPVCII
jgi:hypothetical protein